MHQQTLRGLLDDLGREIRNLRQERGWTQAQAAERLGTTLRHYQAIEAGGRNLTIATLFALARRFGVPFVALFATPASREPRRPGRPATRTSLAPPTIPNPVKQKKTKPTNGRRS